MLKPFRSREIRYRKNAPSNQETELSIKFHMFEKRRAYYLRFGQINHGKIGLGSSKLFRVLHNKSRDEIEPKFMELETTLNFIE